MASGDKKGFHAILHDVREIYEMLKEYGYQEVLVLEEYPYTGKRHYYTKELL